MSDPTPIPTDREVLLLKRKWLRDPSFVLEDTPGFEALHDELFRWRVAFEANVQTIGRPLLRELLIADDLEQPGNIRLVRVLEDFDTRLAVIEKKLNIRRENNGLFR